MFMTDYLAAPLADPDFFAAGPPYELFARLRSEEPVAWTPEADGPGFWSVTRHADIVSVSRDWEGFSSARGVSLEELDEEQLAHRRALIDTDPPRHTPMRKLVAGSFSPRIVNTFETFLRGIVGRALDEALPRGEFEFVEAVSSEVPVRVLCRLLDVSDDDYRRITEWGDRLVGNTDPELADVMLGSAESEAYRLVPFRSPAALEVFEYGRELAAKRREQSGDDLISTLVDAEIDGESLTQQELDNYLLLLILAGQETTRQAITLAMMTLIEHPETLTYLGQDPARVTLPVVDEFLRWGPPVYHMRRTATRDVDLGGASVKAGDKVLLWFPAGNRDDQVIDRADVFDVQRGPVDLLTFGKGGPHYCMGSHLARLELKVTLQELTARLGSACLAGDPERLRSNFVNGVKRLPVSVSER